MNGRLYDPVLGRVLSPDNYVQNAYGTQDYNRYSYAHNNPLVYTDPDGNNPLIGALIGGLSYTLGVAFSKGGFKNWSWFGFSMSVVSGIITSGFAAQLGASLSTASNLTFLAKGAIQIGAYSGMGGLTSYLSGGDFVSGAIGGAAGSVMGSLMGSLTSGMNNFWATTSTIGSSALVGGIGAEVSGGDFWRGAATSGLTAAFNHAAHRMIDRQPAPKGSSPRRLSPSGQQALKMKIMADDEITLGEAGQWYRLGDGSSLEISAKSVSVGDFSAKDFPGGIGSVIGRQTLYRRNGRVYGQLLFQLLENNRIRILPDKYDFQIDPWKGSIIRNFATMSGQSYAGSAGGSAFSIIFTGTIPLH